MSNQETVAGVGVIVGAFTSEDAADEALRTLKKAKKQKAVYFEDAAVIRQDAAGKVYYHETGDMRTDQGMGLGALIGGAIGILGGPLGIAVGMGAGAAVGAAAAHSDGGFRDSSLELMGTALKPDSSALVAITSHAFLKAMRNNVTEADAHAAVQQLAEGISAQLEAGKNAGYGLAITEAGVAVVALAADDKTAQIMKVVATEEGVAGAAAVVTAEGVVVEEAVVTEEGAVVRGAIVTKDETVAGAAMIPPEAEEEAKQE